MIILKIFIKIKKIFWNSTFLKEIYFMDFFKKVKFIKT